MIDISYAGLQITESYPSLKIIYCKGDQKYYQS
ncbi:hypothetical protein I3760_05G159800 [Carya illinoinensis]|nr:hypothetical protein I3760_05G159800 [Carya illinoinensis]